MVRSDKQYGARPPTLVVVSALGVFLLATALPAIGTGPATTTITSNGLGTTVTQAGQVYNLTGGTRPANGPNLFHSFGKFSVAAGHTANFSNDAALPTTNILSRVTGGMPSHIYGMLQTTGFGAANLYLINPAGVVFGPTASLNVGGSFAVSTADYLRHTDGARFNALPGPADTLLSAAPIEAFGFTATHAAPILVESSTLAVPSGKTLTLVSGDRVTPLGARTVDALTITGSGQLTAPGGRIELASVASPGVVQIADVAGGPALIAEVPAQGQIRLSEAARLETSGDGGGTIVLRGSDLHVDGATLTAANRGAANSPDTGIDLHATESVSVLADALISTSAEGVGAAGDIAMQTRTLKLQDRARIRSTTDGDGAGGGITVTADQVRLSSATADRAVSSGLFTESRGTGAAAGRAGTIVVNANEVAVLDGARIDSTTYGDGAGGKVAVTAEQITLAGKVTVPVDSVGPDTSDKGRFSYGLSTQTLGVGKAGDLVVQTRALETRDGAQISSVTFGPGDGGSIAIHGLDGGGSLADTVMLSGATPNGLYAGGVLTMSLERNVAAGNGTPGNLVVQSKTLEVRNGAQLHTSNGNEGARGNVTIAAHKLTLAGEGELNTKNYRVASGVFALSEGKSESTSSSSAGPGGDIEVNTARLTISDGAQINSKTTSRHAHIRAGDITISASDTVELNGGKLIAETEGAGDAGAVLVRQARTVVLHDGSVISSTTKGSGAGGTIAINAEDSVSLLRSSLYAGSVEKGGDATVVDTIVLRAKTLDLRGRGTEIGTGTDTAGRGGSIHMAADEVRIADGAKISAQSTESGLAGSITIEGRTSAHPAQRITLTDDSTITTLAEKANKGGDITLLATDLILLRDSEVTTSVLGGPQTQGGNILIDPQFVVLQNSRVVAQAQAGAGGRIDIVANTFLSSPGSVIDASSSSGGVSGSVNVQAPIQSLSGAIVPLEQSFLDAAALLSKHCAAQRGGRFSSFVVRGRERILAEPGSWLSSPLMPSGEFVAMPPPSTSTSRSERPHLMSMHAAGKDCD